MDFLFQSKLMVEEVKRKALYFSEVYLPLSEKRIATKALTVRKAHGRIHL